MPREQINHPQRVDAATGAALHVSWQKDTHVQVAFEADPAYLRMAAACPNEADGRTTVWTGVLSPDEVTKLVRVLRRARRQAYGPTRPAGRRLHDSERIPV